MKILNCTHTALLSSRLECLCKRHTHCHTCTLFFFFLTKVCYLCNLFSQFTILGHFSCNKLPKTKLCVSERRESKWAWLVFVFILKRTSIDTIFEKCIFNKSIISSRNSVNILFSLRETALQKQWQSSTISPISVNLSEYYVVLIRQRAEQAGRENDNR